MVSVSNVAENCETVTEAIQAEGNEGMAFTADCTKAEEVDKLVEVHTEWSERVTTLTSQYGSSPHSSSSFILASEGHHRQVRKM